MKLIAPGSFSHTPRQQLKARANATTPEVKRRANQTHWDNVATRLIPPLRDYVLDKPEPEPRDADGRFCPRRTDGKG